ncbi:MAG TPA: VOC family protein [Thermoanaerobaculia bacterium]
MPQLNAYLSFNGNCTEAMRFYERTLGGKLQLLTFAETPAAGQTPPADANKIMHAYLDLDGGQALMAADAPSHMKFEPMKGCALALSYGTAEEGRRIFEALGEGGKITMPYEATFWADGFGMVDDRFGTHWIINGGMKPM